MIGPEPHPLRIWPAGHAGSVEHSLIAVQRDKVRKDGGKGGESADRKRDEERYTEQEKEREGLWRSWEELGGAGRAYLQTSQVSKYCESPQGLQVAPPPVESRFPSFVFVLRQKGSAPERGDRREMDGGREGGWEGGKEGGRDERESERERARDEGRERLRDRRSSTRTQSPPIRSSYSFPPQPCIGIDRN